MSTEFQALHEDPVLTKRLRALSVSSGSVNTSTEDTESEVSVTPPGSPSPIARGQLTPPHLTERQRSHDIDNSLSTEGRWELHETPPKPTSSPAICVTPDPPILVLGAVVECIVTPPTPPRTRNNSSVSPTSSPESPGLAARRAAAGKLPNKALMSLQQMRFESRDAEFGLGVGPGSPGFVDMEGLSPEATGNAGLAFRLALGLDQVEENTKPAEIEKPTTIKAPRADLENSAVGSATFGTPSPVAAATLARSTSNRRRLLGLNTSPDMIKIPPSLRGTKYDKFTSPTATPVSLLSSPSSLPSSRPRYAATPPSPIIVRSSAYSHTNTGPLTPLTPSHLPGAPNLSGESFEWSPYTRSESPECRDSTHSTPLKSVFFEGGVSPRQAYFLPTPPGDNMGGRVSPSYSPMKSMGNGIGQGKSQMRPGSPLSPIKNSFF